MKLKAKVSLPLHAVVVIVVVVWGRGGGAAVCLHPWSGATMRTDCHHRRRTKTHLLVGRLTECGWLTALGSLWPVLFISSTRQYVKKGYMVVAAQVLPEGRGLFISSAQRAPTLAVEQSLVFDGMIFFPRDIFMAQAVSTN